MTDMCQAYRATHIYRTEGLRRDISELEDKIERLGKYLNSLIGNFFPPVGRLWEYIGSVLTLKTKQTKRGSILTVQKKKKRVVK